MSEELVVVETMAGSSVIGKVFDNTQFDLSVSMGKPVTIYEVFKIVTFTMPTGPGQVRRVIKLTEMDFVRGCLPELTVNVSSYYRLAEDSVKPEMEDLMKRASQPPTQGDTSPIVPAKVIPGPLRNWK